MIYSTVKSRLWALKVNASPASSIYFFTSLATDVDVTSTRRYVTSKIDIASHNAILSNSLPKVNYTLQIIQTWMRLHKMWHLIWVRIVYKTLDCKITQNSSNQVLCDFLNLSCLRIITTSRQS